MLMQVLAQLKQAMAECNEASSFLLTDNSTLPFAARDIVAHIGDKVWSCWSIDVGGYLQPGTVTMAIC